MILKGRIDEIINLNSAQDGKILFLFSLLENKKVPNMKDGKILCRSFPSSISTLAPVELNGTFDGDTFDVDHLKIQFFDDQSMIDYLVHVCKGQRVGRITLTKIVSTFKESLLSMGSTELEKQLIEQFPNISALKRKLIIDALYDQSDDLLNQLFKLFANSFIENEQILAIYDKYKKDSIKYLKENAYNIGLEFNIKYSAIDLITNKFGLDPFSYIRLEGLMHYALEANASQGHTWMYAKDLVKKVSRMSKQSAYMTEILPIHIANATIYSKRFILDGNKIALKKYYTAELLIAQKLNLLKQTKSYIQVTKDDINEIANELNFNFGKEQREAFRLLETGGVNILTGGPGTGKTSIVKGIVKLYMKRNPGNKIAFCAPTGRASKQLSIATNYPAKTIHKLLDYKPFENGLCIKKTQADPIDADFIIIDEFSMVDAELMSMFLEAVKMGTRLLLVGDENQLPSIGAGNLLHDIIKSKKFPVYKLTENFRQKGAGSIIDNANLILKGEKPKISDDFKIYKAKSEEDAYNGLCYFMKELYHSDDPFLTQLIEPSRKGIAGTYKMNQFVHKNMVHSKLNDVHNGPMIHDKIIFKTTNYDSGYVNGDIGIITAIVNNEIVVWNDHEELLLPLSALSDMELAYSYTIHKSQGSENSNIIIYLPEEMSHMMTRSLFYTAVTRAKKKVIIIYTGDALERCLRNTSDKKRNTRLTDFL